MWVWSLRIRRKVACAWSLWFNLRIWCPVSWRIGPTKLTRGKFTLVSPKDDDLRIIGQNLQETIIEIGSRDHTRPAEMAAAGITGFVKGIDCRGSPVVAHIDEIPGSPWWLVVKKDQAEINGRVFTRVRMVALLLLVSVLFLAGLFALMLVREARMDYGKKIRENEIKEGRFRDAIRGAPDPAMIFAEDGKIIEVNRAWEQRSGYAAQDMVTIDDWIALAYPHKASAFSTRFAEIFTGASDEGRFDCRPRTAEGKLCYWTCGWAIA